MKKYTSTIDCPADSDWDSKRKPSTTCGELNPTQMFCCTRKSRHSGPHHGHEKMICLAVWGLGKLKSENPLWRKAERKMLGEAARMGL